MQHLPQRVLYLTRSPWLAMTLDVLVRSRDLVDHPCVPGPRCRASVLHDRPRIHASLHCDSCGDQPVRARAERLQIAATAHDALRAPMLPGMMPSSPSRAEIAPLREIDIGAKVMLTADIVVVAIDRLVGQRERGRCFCTGRDGGTHHHLAIQPRVVLRPPPRRGCSRRTARCLHAGTPDPCRAVHARAAHVALGALDEVTAESRCRCRAIRCAALPTRSVSSRRKANEVIAVAQRTKLAAPGALELALHLHD